MRTSSVPFSPVIQTAPTPQLSPTPAKSQNIILESPKAGETVGLPLKVSGQARVFENVLQVRLKEKDGKLLVEKRVMAQSPDAGIFGPFDLSLSYPQPSTKEGIVEAFQYSAKDGSEVDKVRVPVIFGDVEFLTVKAFLGNLKKAPGGCEQVFAVERRIFKTQAVARAALVELLQGPTNNEGDEGYFTSLNEGVKIQKLTIENGVARVDFDELLEVGVGGSCRVAGIRAQITQTLKQFSTVKEVVISINGRTEDILQP